MAWICKACGKINETGAKNCKFCGAPSSLQVKEQWRKKYPIGEGKGSKEFPCKNCGSPITGYPCSICKYDPRPPEEKTFGLKALGLPTDPKLLAALIAISLFWTVIIFSFLRPLLDFVIIQLGLAGGFLVGALNFILALIIGLMMGQLTIGLGLKGVIRTLVFSVFLTLLFYFVPPFSFLFLIIPFGGLPLAFLVSYGINAIIARGIKSSLWHMAIVVVIIIGMYIGGMLYIEGFGVGIPPEICMLQCRAEGLQALTDPAGAEIICRRKCYGAEAKKIGCTDCLTFSTEPKIVPVTPGEMEIIDVKLEVSKDATPDTLFRNIGVVVRDNIPAEIVNLGVLCPICECDDKTKICTAGCGYAGMHCKTVEDCAECSLAPGKSAILRAVFNETPNCTDIGAEFKYRTSVRYTYDVTGELKIKIKSPELAEVKIGEKDAATTTAGPINFAIVSSEIEYVVGWVTEDLITIEFKNLVDGRANITNLTITQEPPFGKRLLGFNCSGFEEKEINKTFGLAKSFPLVKKDSTRAYLCTLTIPKDILEGVDFLTYIFRGWAEYEFTKEKDRDGREVRSIAVDKTECK